MDEQLAERLYHVLLSRLNVEEGGLSDVTCTWCGQAQWQLQGLARHYRLEDKRTVPVVSLLCTCCGLILTFDLKALGFDDLDELQGRVAG